MEQDTLAKFVANMRAQGQPDDMIAESLISAGHAELMVLNALGVSTMEELYEEEAEPASAAEPAAQPAAIPSTLEILDAEGNMVIEPDNAPQAVGADPKPEPASAQATAQARPTPPSHGGGVPFRPQDRPAVRRARRYPRPAQRKVTQRSTAHLEPNKQAPKPTLEPVTPKPDMNKLVQEDSAPKPLTPPSHKPTKPKLEPIKPGHHTFDDFMGRIKGHKEIESGEEHSLEPTYYHGPTRDTMLHSDDQEETHSEPKRLEPTPKSVAPTPAEKRVSKSSPEVDHSLDELLAKQRDEAAAGPGGPEISDLINDKDIGALKDEAERPAGEPSASDLQSIKASEMATPNVQKTGQTIHELRNSVLLKVVVILIGVLVLIGLTASIITRIQG